MGIFRTHGLRRTHLDLYTRFQIDGQNWLQDVFIPEKTHSVPFRWRLLFFDGHGIHGKVAIVKQEVLGSQRLKFILDGKQQVL